MMTAWRVIKKSVEKYNYIGVEFNLETGEAVGVKVHDDETEVRKLRTSQFEVLENGEWITLPAKEARSLLKDFNVARKAQGKPYIAECEVLGLLYKINNL